MSDIPFLTLHAILEDSWRNDIKVLKVRIVSKAGKKQNKNTLKVLEDGMS